MFKTKAASKLDSSSSHFQSVSFDSDDFEELSFKKIKSQLYTSEKFTKETLLKKRGSVSGNELQFFIVNVLKDGIPSTFVIGQNPYAEYKYYVIDYSQNNNDPLGK